MQSLNKWFLKNILRQFFVILFISLIFSTYWVFRFNQNESALVKSVITEISSLVQRGIYKKDRPLIELATEIAFSRLGAQAVLLCDGNKKIIFEGTPETTCDTDEKTNLLFMRNYKKKISGSSSFFVTIEMNSILKSKKILLPLIIIIIFISSILSSLLFTFYRLRSDIINPLIGRSKKKESIILEINSFFNAFRENLYSRASLEVATQVAHDIRSPLAALSGVTKNLNLNAEDPNKKILESVTVRINNIAQDLLDTNKQISLVESDSSDKILENIQLTLCDPQPLIHFAIEEKKLQFAEHQDLHISLSDQKTPSKVSINSNHFSRLLSNLINNSAEAMNFSGEITLSTTIQSNLFTLIITDNGPGIPADILDQLGRRGNTSKASGNGLGIYHAKKSIESWQGNFDVTTSAQGTTITITLPATIAHTTDTEYPVLAQTAAPKPETRTNAILLDDDMLIHMTWEIKAKLAGVELQCFSHPDQLFEQLDSISKDTTFYIDSSLGTDTQGDDIKGEDIAKQLFNLGFTQLYLATGYDPDHFKACTFLKGIIGKEAPFKKEDK